MKKKICVDLIDDDEAVLDALGLYLERRGFEVRRYSRASDFLKAKERQCQSDCIVADLKMPGSSGLDLHRSLTRMGCPTPLILITGYADVSTAVVAMKAGAYDFLEKPVNERRLVSRIRQAAAIAEHRQAELEEMAALNTRLEALSERERQVMMLAADGMTSRQIGVELGISPRTVEIHRASVMEKTGSESVADLVRIAMRIENANAAVVALEK